MNISTLGACVTFLALVACPGTDPPTKRPGAPEEPKPLPTTAPPAVPSPTTPMATPLR
jgi:hypothetical protein